jgi:hypothetical protein
MPVFRHGGLVKSVRRALLDADSPPGAFAETGAEAVTVIIAYQFSLAVDNLQSAFGTTDNAGAATVTFFFVYPDDIPYLWHNTPRFLFFTRKLAPPRLAEALARRGAPVYAGRYLVFVDDLAAFLAPGFHLVGKYLYPGAAFGAFVHRYPQVSHVLTGTFHRHDRHPRRISFRMSL